MQQKRTLLERICEGQLIPLRTLYRQCREVFLAATPKNEPLPVSIQRYQLALLQLIADMRLGTFDPAEDQVIEYLLAYQLKKKETPLTPEAVSAAYPRLSHDGQHAVELLFYRRHLDVAREERSDHLESEEFYRLLSESMRQLLVAYDPSLADASNEDLHLTQQYHLAGLPPAYLKSYTERLEKDVTFRQLHQGMAAIITLADHLTMNELLEILEDEERRIQYPFRSFLGRNIAWMILMVLLLLGLILGMRSCAL